MVREYEIDSGFWVNPSLPEHKKEESCACACDPPFVVEDYASEEERFSRRATSLRFAIDAYGERLVGNVWERADTLVGIATQFYTYLRG